MKKVLSIVPYQYIPYFSGGQKFIAQFNEYLGEITELTAISTPENDINLIKSYAFLPLLASGKSRYINLGLIFKIRNLIKKNKYNAIIWEHPYFGWLAYFIKVITGIRTIFHTHNIEYQRFKSTGKWWWRILKIYERWSLQKADMVFCISAEDQLFIIKHFKIPASHTAVITFGTELSFPPTDKPVYKEILQKRYGLSAGTKIFLFSGLLSYQPNYEAVQFILQNINPILIDKNLFPYVIIICGKGLPNESELKGFKNIIHAGFVDDIIEYVKGADLFLNTVQRGGGIKTKVIEAISYNTTVISTISGAIGIEKNVCGEKLIITSDNDWPAFANAVIKYIGENFSTPEIFYHNYYWGNIVKKASAYF